MKTASLKTYNALHRCLQAGTVALALFGTLSLSVTPAHADDPGKHPFYLHALSDLRYARAYLMHPDERNVVNDQKQAIRDIDDAINLLKQAAIDDGKLLSDHPPIDANLSHKDRLQRAAALLGSANRDLHKEEDNVAVRGWRNHAVGDIDSAFKETRRAMNADFRDDHPLVAGDHPHYLHALSDLRLARAYMAHRDEANVVIDEKNAIIELNQALGEIKRAAIDDGKNPNDHPPIDANLSHKDRLRKALVLLTSARRDLSLDEDNRRALGWRSRALQDLSDAILAARKAIGDDRFDDRH